jgi:hypothetical protein
MASLPPLPNRVKASAAWASGSDHFGWGGEVMAGVLPSARRANSHTEAKGRPWRLPC